VHAFIDGQNLFHAVKRAWGYTFPNFDPLKLSGAVCGLAKDRKLVKVHLYTGVPPQNRDAKWNAFWSAKIRVMTTAGVRVVTRHLRYSQGPAILPNGTVVQDALIPREKGIDLRLGLDVLRMARHGDFDAALIFSQDGDLAEVVQEIADLRKEMQRWLVVDCAMPAGGGFGIAGAQLLAFDKALYDACIDPTDYFPQTKTPKLPGVP
jgi:uncharacterized LabA/DUF88 family protein